jgi:hypothetical protein
MADFVGREDRALRRIGTHSLYFPMIQINPHVIRTYHYYLNTLSAGSLKEVAA